MALVARRFVEPALDARWRTLTSFVPIVKCLPDDLWAVEEGPPPKNHHERSKNIVCFLIYDMVVWSSHLFVGQVLRRSLVRSDLRRYLDHYAHRIRSILPELPEYGSMWVSSQVLLAFQVATSFQAGAFSPRLEYFSWENLEPSRLENRFGPRAIGGFHPCMSLFIGPTLNSIDVALNCDEGPLYLTTLQSLPQWIPQLKKLTLWIDGLDGVTNTSLLQQYLQASPWEHLETFSTFYVESCPVLCFSSSVIRLLSRLPRLQELNLQRSEVPAPIPSDPTSGFSSLTVLKLAAQKLLDIVHFLQYLPPNNALAYVKCVVEVDPDANGQSLQLVINTIENHCSPVALEKLRLCVNEWDENVGEQLDLDEWEGLDISPLLPFNDLADLFIKITSPILLTPDLVQQFPIAWPHMTKLSLDSMFPNSQIPFINHTHFLALLQGLPRLEHLALRFDATRIKGDELAPGAPFRLKILDVGDSPLSSPSRVLKFLKTNLSLKEAPRLNDFLEWKFQLYKDRWMAVKASW